MENQSMNQDSKYIQGIFNYCDRWCEQCTMVSHCRLYDDGQKRLQKHYERGKDPYDMEIVLKDMEEDMKETMQLLSKAAEEQGIDLDNLPDEDCDSPDPKDCPLYIQAHNYSHLVHAFLDKLYKSMEEEGTSFDSDIFSCYEVISWYHALIPAKLYRALSSNMDHEIEEELKQISMEDASGSAKVAYLGLTRSIIALQIIYKWDEGLQDEIITLLAEADKLRKGINNEFPGHKSFKRPGFEV